MGTTEVNLVKIHLVERCTHQVDLNIRIVLPPLIPRLDTPPQQSPHALDLPYVPTSFTISNELGFAFFSLNYITTRDLWAGALREAINAACQLGSRWGGLPPSVRSALTTFSKAASKVS